MYPFDLLHHLAERIAAVPCSHPLRVGIDGIDASGKTTLADELVAPLQALGRPVLRASLDDFHNPRAMRYRRGPDSPEGYFYDSFDYPRLRTLLLDPLGPHGDRSYRAAAFDFRTDTPLQSPTLQASPSAVLLFDGVFLLRPEMDGCWDYTIFLDVPFEAALSRALRRDTALFGSLEAVEARYRRRYIPGQQLYLTACRPQDRADLVIPLLDCDDQNRQSRP